MTGIPSPFSWAVLYAGLLTTGLGRQYNQTCHNFKSLIHLLATFVEGLNLIVFLCFFDVITIATINPMMSMAANRKSIPNRTAAERMPEGKDAFSGVQLIALSASDGLGTGLVAAYKDYSNFY